MGKYTITKNAVDGHVTYCLADSSRRMEVGVVPDIGNFVYEFKVNGNNVLISPQSLKEYGANRESCCGSPFLTPWANRIDHDHYYFQGKKYLLNDSLGNLLRDDFGQVIHGLLAYDARWEVAKNGSSDGRGAWLTSRFEFYRHSDLMAQFPFAHTIEITYRLKDGKLETTTVIHNIGHSPMPVMMAYHPFFCLDGNREEWRLSLCAKTHWLATKRLISTGETEPAEKFLPGAKDFRLGQVFLDDVFSNFDRSIDGFGHVTVKGRTHTVELMYGKEFDFTVVYSPLPPNDPLICIEPQTGPTNSFNLNHEGKFPGLVALEPGRLFKASYWIVPGGY